MTKTILTLLILALCLISTASQNEYRRCSAIPGCDSDACDTSATFCYSCTAGYSYFNGVCNKNACVDSNCELCEHEGNCFKCAITYELVSGANCQPITCGDNCDSCLDRYRCFICSSGFTKNSNG